MSRLEAWLLLPCYRRGHPIYGAAFQLLRCGLEYNRENRACLGTAGLRDLVLPRAAHGAGEA